MMNKLFKFMHTLFNEGYSTLIYEYTVQLWIEYPNYAYTIQLEIEYSNL